MSINCALDGPSGAGKSTIARAVAKKLGYIYVDTGALYRSIGLYAVRSGVDTKSAEEVVPLLGSITVELKYTDGEQRVILNGEDVSGLIRTNEISMAASNVSAIPQVREFLLSLQRDIAEKNNIVMDGRDIGTVILPEAQVKIFMTASAEERAKRRHRELLEKGTEISYEEVLKDINQRDYNDSHRDAAPLKQAQDACLLDTSNMGIDEAVEAVCRIITQKTQESDCRVVEGSDFFPERRRLSKVRLFFYGIFRILALGILRLLISVRYEGLENIPKEGNYIVAPNHVTWMDPVAVAAKIKNVSAYISKEEIFENKLCALLLKPFHAFPVKRGKGDRTALNRSIEYINSGYNLTIFPEGTRSKDGTLGKGKSGVVFISQSARADILPVGITVSRNKGRKRMTVRYGCLIPYQSLETKSLSASEMRRARTMVMDAIGALIENVEKD